MGINSPKPSASKDSQGGVANKNISIGGSSHKNNSLLVSPNRAMYAQEDIVTKYENQQSVSPVLSIGEEVLTNSTLAGENCAKETTATQPSMKGKGSETEYAEKSSQPFCDPLLRRESDSNNADPSLEVTDVKDSNVSKVVEKCQSSV